METETSEIRNPSSLKLRRTGLKFETKRQGIAPSPHRRWSVLGLRSFSEAGPLQVLPSPRHYAIGVPSQSPGLPGSGLLKVLGERIPNPIGAPSKEQADSDRKHKHSISGTDPFTTPSEETPIPHFEEPGFDEKTRKSSGTGIKPCGGGASRARRSHREAARRAQARARLDSACSQSSRRRSWSVW